MIVSVPTGRVVLAIDVAVPAEILVRVAHSPNPPTHLPLGVNAIQMSLDYWKRQLDEAQAWDAVSRSADFGLPYPVDLPSQ